MSVEPYLMNDEDVLAYCTTDYWAWVCTNRRVVKYRQGSGGAEQLHDLSFGEITGISLVNTGRNDTLGGYGVIAVLGGLLLTVSEFPVLSIVPVGIGVYLLYRWMNSEEAYFEFRGSGLLQTEGKQWRIDQTAADDPDQVQEFVRKVRSQL